ncbi:hypothetical protein D3C76_1403120 [compost metagenome]
MVPGSNGDGALGGHGEPWVEGIGHAAPPVHAGADAGVVTDNRQWQGIGHALGLAQGRIAPVTQGVEAPGLQAIERVRLPARGVQHQRRAVGRRLPLDTGWAWLAIGTLDVGGIEVEPAPLLEVTPL